MNDGPPDQALSLTQGSAANIKETHRNGSQTHLLELPYSPDPGQRGRQRLMLLPALFPSMPLMCDFAMPQATDFILANHTLVLPDLV